MSRAKISLIGGGQIGGILALLAAQKELGNIKIFDIPNAEGMVKGKALDIMQLRPHDGFDANISGTSDWNDLKDSDVFIVTAGIPRKPGMNREDLLDINLGIMKDVASNIKKVAPNSFVIIVSNPLDAMVQHAYNISGFDSKRVIGMAGILDTARFSTFIAEELNVSVESVNAYVLGGHGDTMVPVIGATNVGGVPVENMIEKNKLASIVQRTRDGGAEIVALLKTGSAFYAPSASIVQMVEAILLDKQQILPCAALLSGEYGFNDVYAGVPVKLGANGIEEVIEVDLNKDEHSALSKSVDSVIELLDIMKKN